MIYNKPWVLFGVVDMMNVCLDNIKEEINKFKRVLKFIKIESNGREV